MLKTCQECHQPYQTRKSQKKFCSLACYHIKARREPNSGTFPPGESNRIVSVGTITVRKHKRDGKRAWIKIANPSVWQLRAVYVWETANHKTLPKGMIVHHKDRNPLNDTPDNLVALTRAEHIKEHRSDFQKRRYRRRPQINHPAASMAQVV